MVSKTTRRSAKTGQMLPAAPAALAKRPENEPRTAQVPAGVLAQPRAPEPVAAPIPDLDTGKDTRDVTRMKLSDLTTRPDLNPRRGINLAHVERIARSYRLDPTAIPPVRVRPFRAKDGSLSYVVTRGNHRTDAMRAVVASKDLGNFDPDRVAVEMAPETDSLAVLMADYIDHGAKPLSGITEWARACFALKLAGYSPKQIAERLSLGSDTTVRNHLRVAALPPAVRDWIADAESPANAKLDESKRKNVNQAIALGLATAYAKHAGLSDGSKIAEDSIGAIPYEQLWKEIQETNGARITSKDGKNLAAEVRKTVAVKALTELRLTIENRAQPVSRAAMLATVDAALSGDLSAVAAYLSAD